MIFTDSTWRFSSFLPLNRRMVVRSPFPLRARMLVYPSIQNGFRILSNWSYPYSTGTTILLSCFTTYCRLRIYPHASYISAPFLTRLSMMPEVLAVCRSFATCCQFGQSGKVGPSVSSKQSFHESILPYGPFPSLSFNQFSLFTLAFPELLI